MKGVRKITATILCILGAFIVFGGSAVGNEINIGFTGPLTGPAAYIGLDSMHGAMIAAKEINDAGGVVVAGKKYTVTIRTYDDEGNAAKAVAGMQKLKDRYNVPVINQNISAAIMGMLEKNEQLGILLIGYFKHPEATNRGNKLLLRQENKVVDEAYMLAKAAVKYYKVKTYATLLDVGDYGKTFDAGYKDICGKLGVKQVASEWMDMRTQTDFRGQLTKIKAANPDVIMIAAYDEASAGIIKQAHELGIKVPFCVTSGFQSVGEKLTGPDLVEGYLKPLQHHSKTPPPLAVTRYRNELYPKMDFKEPCGPYGMGVYQQIHTIVKAMKIAGTTTDAMKIRQAVPSTVPIEEKYDMMAVKGWKDNGDAIVDEMIGRYKNGKCLWDVSK